MLDELGGNSDDSQNRKFYDHEVGRVGAPAQVAETIATHISAQPFGLAWACGMPSYLTCTACGEHVKP